MLQHLYLVSSLTQYKPLWRLLLDWLVQVNAKMGEHLHEVV
jgi:hypothetical protein